MNSLRPSEERQVIEIHESFCESMNEILNSPDFERVFSIVLDKNPRYSKDYFIWILRKIKMNQNLEEIEKNEFLIFLEDELVFKTANDIISKIKTINFTMGEVKKFLEEYPVKSIIDSLKYYSRRRIIDLIWWDFAEFVFENENIKMYKKIDKNWNSKYCIKKIEEEKLNEDDFKFDFIWNIILIYWDIYYIATIWCSKWVIRLGDEDQSDERVIFRYVWNIWWSDWEVYFLASNWRIGSKKINYKTQQQVDFRD